MEFSNLAILSGLGTWFFLFLVKKSSMRKWFSSREKIVPFWIPCLLLRSVFHETFLEMEWIWRENWNHLLGRSRKVLIHIVCSQHRSDIYSLPFELFFVVWFFFSVFLIRYNCYQNNRKRWKTQKGIILYTLPSPTINHSIIFFVSHSLIDQYADWDYKTYKTFAHRNKFCEVFWAFDRMFIMYYNIRKQSWRQSSSFTTYYTVWSLNKMSKVSTE